MKKERILTGHYRQAFLTVCVIGTAAVILLLALAAREKKEFVYPIDQRIVSADNEALPGPGELPAGIYMIEVEYQTEADFAYTFGMQDEELPPLKMMYNNQNLAAGRSSAVFHLWLLEKSENFKLFVSGSSEQGIYLQQVRIVNTGQFFYCLILGVLLLGMVILGGIFCAARYHVRKIPASDFVLAGLIVFLTIFLSRPFLMNWISLTGDVSYHLERIDGVAVSLKNGVFPMRLEPNFPFAYGYADGVLYGSTLLYIPALLWLIGLPVLYYYNIFIILINLATILTACYCFGRMFRDKYIGLMCSALYSFSLYRITVLYGRGCLGEGCAQIFLPLLLYGYYRLFTEDTNERSYQNIWPLLVIGYSGVLQSHTLTCELALFWTVVVCLVNLRRLRQKNTFKVLLKAAAVTILCNLWYAVPFLDYYLSQDLLIKNLGKQTIQQGGITPDLVFIHFFDGVLTDSLGNPIRAAGPGLIPMLALLVFFALGGFCLVRHKKSKLLAGAGLCAVLSAICIVFSLKAFPWDAFQQTGPVAERIVSSFLIPTRFLNWGTLFLVPAFGYCLWYAKYESRWKKISFLLGSAAVILFVGTSSGYLLYQITHTYERVRVFDNNQIYGYVSGGEYVIYGTDTSKLTYGSPQASAEVKLTDYVKGDLGADFRCVNDSPAREGYVEVPLFLYKGYEARAGAGEKLACVYGDNNVIRVLIPPGFDDSVSVRFVSPIYWRLSEAVSWLTWLLAAAWCVWTVRKGRRVTVS